MEITLSDLSDIATIIWLGLTVWQVIKIKEKVWTLQSQVQSLNQSISQHTTLDNKVIINPPDFTKVDTSKVKYVDAETYNNLVDRLQRLRTKQIRLTESNSIWINKIKKHINKHHPDDKIDERDYVLVNKTA